MPNSQSSEYSNTHFKGAIFLIIGEIMLVIMAAIIKYATETLPTINVVFFRTFFGFVFLIPILIPYGLSMLKTQVFHLHFMRSAVGLIAMISFFVVIDNTQLAQASLVKLTSPFFLPIIAYLWLDEKILRQNWLAIIIGFIGVIFIIQPGTDQFSWYLILGLFAACLASIAKTTIRRMALTEPSVRVVFYFALLTTLFSAVLVSFSWVTPSFDQLFWLALTGLCGTIGQLFITKAYQIAKPGQIGPYTYVSVIFAALFGWYFWDEKITLAILMGSLLITFAGIINLRSKNT